MTRREAYMAMSDEDLAQRIIHAGFTSDYCKSDCDDDNCPHEVECCVRWLGEEV